MTQELIKGMASVEEQVQAQTAEVSRLKDAESRALESMVFIEGVAETVRQSRLAPSPGRRFISVSRLFYHPTQNAVEDNGPGIDPEILPRVFDPFFTTKDVDRGTGLGLAIARSIIENYQGKIVVESIKRKGARFIITLPAMEK